MSLNLLKELIPLMEKFEEHCYNIDIEPGIENFTLWLLKREKQQESVSEIKSPSMPLQGNLNAQIVQLIALMNKYLRFYLKKGFEGTALAGPDDFGFLATLYLEGNLRKNELIEKNTMEFSSGMEVIKRLEKNGLIESLPDREDKRAKIVRITDFGSQLLRELLPVMGQIGAIATGNMNDSERLYLLDLLNKLNRFHSPIFHGAKKETLPEIFRQNIKTTD